MDFVFFVTCAGLGIGLAMDAFSVSLANGLHEPCMNKKKTLVTAGTFALFQGAMPLIGWICVHTVLQYFQAFEKAIPFIAFGLLAFIGGKMIWEGLHEESDCCACEPQKINAWSLMVQGVATSIDALSVGFTIAAYGVLEAIVCASVIMALTFGICWAGVELGKKFGTKFSGKATVFGGVILVIIGLELLITGLL